MLLGLKKLRSQDDPKIIRAYADILGSLMQPTDRSSVDYLNMHEFTSSIGINILSLNHGESEVGQQGGVQHADEGPTDRQDDDAE